MSSSPSAAAPCGSASGRKCSGSEAPSLPPPSQPLGPRSAWCWGMSPGASITSALVLGGRGSARTRHPVPLAPARRSRGSGAAPPASRPAPGPASLLPRGLWSPGAQCPAGPLIPRKKLSNFLHAQQWRAASNYVAKRYLEPVDRGVYFEDVRLQMEAKLWGQEYNRHKPPKQVRPPARPRPARRPGQGDRWRRCQPGLLPHGLTVAAPGTSTGPGAGLHGCLF